MTFATCGHDCNKCDYYGLECRGCAASSGNPFWAEFRGYSACPVSNCAKENEYASCAQCKKVPCEHWEDVRDPELNEDEYERLVEERKQNLYMFLHYLKLQKDKNG
ncbi:MAG: DUF3795 domain-containing protein [Ruminococcaceae bacterium]|nr:DUF3795 domain-containing protein [Oscillospiraceae bacterium]